MTYIVTPLDTETTGLVEPEHRIVQVYLSHWDLATRKRLGRVNQFIDPKRSMPAEAQRVHKIAITDLIGQPDWETVGPAIHAELARSNVLVAHNAAFDRDMLNMEFRRIGLPPITVPFFCTMENAIWATANGKKPSLTELCFALGVDYDEGAAHKADYDVEVMTACLWKGLDWGWFKLEEMA